MATATASDLATTERMIRDSRVINFKERSAYETKSTMFRDLVQKGRQHLLVSTQIRFLDEHFLRGSSRSPSNTKPRPTGGQAEFFNASFQRDSFAGDPARGQHRPDRSMRQRSIAVSAIQIELLGEPWSR